MKRGIRPIWRDLASAAQKVADSKNYAEEYIYTAEFFNRLEALGRLVRVDKEDEARAGSRRPT